MKRTIAVILALNICLLSACGTAAAADIYALPYTDGAVELDAASGISAKELSE